MDSEQVVDLLGFGARRELELVLDKPSPHARPALERLLDATRVKIQSSVSTSTRAALTQRLRRRAHELWDRQAFELSSLRLRELSIRVARARKSMNPGEEWRVKAILFLASEVLSQSRFVDLFQEEERQIRGAEAQTDVGAAPLVLRWKGDHFDLEPAEFERQVSSPECRWVWIVTDCAEDLPRSAWDGLGHSPFERLANAQQLWARVSCAGEHEALSDLDRLLASDLWTWRHLPFFLLHE